MRNFKNTRNFKNIKDIRKFAIKKTKEAIKRNYANEEFVLIQAINAYNELSKSYNLFFERINEWFGLYFPEISLTSINQLNEFFKGLENKNKLEINDFYKIFDDKSKAEAIYQKYLNTSGRNLDENEKKIIIMFLKYIKNTDETLKNFEEYLKQTSNKLMPNTTYLTDEKIAAELLNKAGSLEKLSIMPSSTIQLLGAEKALFKHIKFGSKPPKYGVLFKLPAITNAKRNIRGKIARLYAAKISIGLKGDVISKRFIAKELKDSIDKTLEKIKKNN